MRTYAAIGLSVFLAGCLGQIGDAETGAADESTASAPDAPLDCATITPGSAVPLRRLTRAQYNNTVAALLGDTSRPADEWPPDEQLGSFARGAAVSPLQLGLYQQAAEALAQAATENLDALVACDVASEGELGCADRWIERFGLRTYRRPLTAEERSTYRSLYETHRENGHENGLRMVIATMLQSPHFLYRVELGEAAPTVPDGVRRLTDYEVASRLSYLLWNTMPDDELFRAAAAGELSTSEQVEAQARRMVEDARAREAAVAFVRDWLELRIDDLEKDPEAFPEFDENVRGRLAESLDRFLADVLGTGPGTLTELFTADFGYVDRDLAFLYGLEDVSAEELVRVDLDPRERAGILTHPAFLAKHAAPDSTDPVLRGKIVRERLFCQMLPSPPADLEISVPDPDPDLTTRERFANHRTDPSCNSCHRLVDPIGFALEEFDAIGRFRTEENGIPLDVSGEIVATESTDGSFVGSVELAERLSTSDDVRACAAEQWLRFGLGRPSTPADRCAVDTIGERFARDGYRIESLLVAITATDAFLHRPAPEGLSR